ncbi:hypothetical protein QYF36_020661 [Acer negundo]|nr:hypothetical protein QYF36_020661 [Acer negundo]
MKTDHNIINQDRFTLCQGQRLQLYQTFLSTLLSLSPCFFKRLISVIINILLFWRLSGDDLRPGYRYYVCWIHSEAGLRSS